MDVIDFVGMLSSWLPFVVIDESILLVAKSVVALFVLSETMLAMPVVKWLLLMNDGPPEGTFVPDKFVLVTAMVETSLES